MRWTILFFLLALPVCSGCGSKTSEQGDAARKADLKFAAPAPAGREGVEQDLAVNKQLAAQEGPGAPAPLKGVEPLQKEKEKPRKIRYTADMQLIVDKLAEAEEALDAARKEAKAEYEKMEVNTSAGTVRKGEWRVRVPVDNLNSFRKAVKKIGDVERDTIESEDMTAKYYDLDTHLINRKAEQQVTREFLIEIGKKDPRYLEVKRELDLISDDINIKEGRLKLWANLTDLTTFTIKMREKLPYVEEKKVADKEIPTFNMRASTTWNNSWDLFIGFCQGVIIIVIAIAPWLPIPLVFFLCLWLVVRLLVRASPKPPVVVAAVAEETPKPKPPKS